MLDSVIRRRRFVYPLIGIAALTFLYFLPGPALFRSRSQPQEIHALLHYVVHKPQQTLPPLDPTRPVNLQVYESGDLEVANWTERVQTLDNETPLVVFSKTYCPYSKAAKAVLKQYDLSPAPSIVEVDLREDGGILKALLTRLTGRGTFPNVVLQGKTLGGYDDLWALHQAGVLQSTFERAGVKVRGNVSELTD